LPDPVADLGDLVESSVGPETEVGTRNVVADGGRKNDDRNPEFRILVPVLGQQEGGVEGLEPAQHQDAADLVVSQLRRIR
jgi:hypothetical protein